MGTYAMPTATAAEAVLMSVQLDMQMTQHYACTKEQATHRYLVTTRSASRVPWLTLEEPDVHSIHDT